MELITDTIAAISTPPGTGGIAVIRLAGPDAFHIFSKIWKGADLKDAPSHTAHLGYVIDPEDMRIIDQSVATVFKSPASFTGDDTVEISCHGSDYIQREILHALVRAGARTAQPGEFTQRAFLNRRIDLAQAEGIADLIAASTQGAHDIAMSQTKGAFSSALEGMRRQLIELASLLELELDFSEEDVEFADRTRLLSLAETILATIRSLTESYSAGQAIRDGIEVAIAGMPNAGKSTLLNCLANDDKAIVSDIPGTTRDTIEVSASYCGLLFRFIDTAGLRPTDDAIENLGIDRARTALRKARFILWLIDPTQPLNPQISLLKENTFGTNPENILILINKTDITDRAIEFHNKMLAGTSVPKENTFSISAKNGHGIDTAIAKIAESIVGSYDPRRETVIANARHYEALVRAGESLSRTITGLTDRLPTDMVAQDLRETLSHLGSITGAITTPDLLTTIFSRFCIGK